MILTRTLEVPVIKVYNIRPVSLTFEVLLIKIVRFFRPPK